MKFDFEFAFNPSTIILVLVAIGLIYCIFTFFTTKQNDTQNDAQNDSLNDVMQAPLESSINDANTSFHPDPDTSDKVFLNDDGLATANEISQFPYKELETNVVNEMYTTDAPLFDTTNKQPLVTPNIESSQRRVNFNEM